MKATISYTRVFLNAVRWLTLTHLSEETFPNCCAFFCCFYLTSKDRSRHEGCQCVLSTATGRTSEGAHAPLTDMFTTATTHPASNHSLFLFFLFQYWLFNRRWNLHTFVLSQTQCIKNVHGEVCSGTNISSTVQHVAVSMT